MKTTMNTAFILLAAVVGFGIPLTSSATTLQFENVTAPGSLYLGSNYSYAESGYALQGLVPSMWGIVSPSHGNASWFGPISSSDFFFAPAWANPILAEQQNATFSLNSIDIGVATGPADNFGSFSGGTFDFQGITDNSSTFDYSFTLTDTSWHTLSLKDNPNFQNLKSLSIQFIPQNDSMYSIALDNISVSTVPVPQGFYLLGSALLPLASRIARRKAAAKSE